jgi:hypothetical protein
MPGKVLDHRPQLIRAHRVGQNDRSGSACLSLERTKLPVGGHAVAEWHPIAG